MANRRSAKQKVLKIIQGLPQESSYDELLQELLMNRITEQGLADVRSRSDDL
jgi:hypothetical protein